MPAETETASIELPPRQLTIKERVMSNLVQAPLFFSATAAFGTVSLLASLTEKDGRRQHRIARAWAKCSLAIAGSPIHVTGLDVLHNHPVAVYTCQPSLLYGYAGHLRGAAIPVPDPRAQRSLEDALHRLAPGPLRPDPGRGRQSARLHRQPYGRGARP